MKSKLLLAFLALFLTSCGSKIGSDGESYDFSIVAPTGAPSIAFYKFSTNDHFQTNSDPANIIPMMVKETVDIAVLPTNAGIQAIENKKINYKIAATITFGNIFVASTGNDTKDGIMGADDYIVSFQQGAVPDKIFHYIYGNELDSAIHYVASAQEAAKCLKLGKNLADDGKAVDYVVLAEPALTNVLSSTPNASVYANLQELYKVKSSNLQIFQASIFVRNSLLKTNIDCFLNDLQNDIKDALDNPDLISDYLSKNSASEVIYGIKPELAKIVTINNNGMGLGFALAKDNKNAIDLFLSLFGIGETNEEIFYK